jgi:hypothetical protein
VWVKTSTFASTAVFPDCVNSRWEGAYSDTGSASTPSGATLLSSYFRYLDSGSTAAAVTLNRFGVGIGNAVPSSGAGLTFPATQVASSNANTLDDYEEGTWTPTLTTNSTPPTITAYSTRTGSYTKIGNLITVTCSVRCTITSVGSGVARVTGLPFSSADFLDGVALGLRDCFAVVNPSYAFVTSNVVEFNSALITGDNLYATFTVSYRVA